MQREIYQEKKIQLTETRKKKYFTSLGRKGKNIQGYIEAEQQKKKKNSQIETNKNKLT